MTDDGQWQAARRRRDHQTVAEWQQAARQRRKRWVNLAWWVSVIFAAAGLLFYLYTD